jgi:hypothetical protein
VADGTRRIFDVAGTIVTGRVRAEDFAFDDWIGAEHELMKMGARTP